MYSLYFFYCQLIQSACNLASNVHTMHEVLGAFRMSEKEHGKKRDREKTHADDAIAASSHGELIAKADYFSGKEIQRTEQPLVESINKVRRKDNSTRYEGRTAALMVVTTSSRKPRWC